MLQGPYAAGTGLGDAFKWTIVSRHPPYATTDAIAERRLILLVARAPDPHLAAAREPHEASCSPVVDRGLRRRRRPRAGRDARSRRATRRPATETFFAVPLDTLHVLAMCVWLGGLVALVASALGGGFSGGLRRALIVFSRLAFWCVIVLVLTGIFASWRQVGFRIKGYTRHVVRATCCSSSSASSWCSSRVAAISRSDRAQARRSAPLDAPDTAIAAIDETHRTTACGASRSASRCCSALAVLSSPRCSSTRSPHAARSTPELFSTEVKAGTPADADRRHRRSGQGRARTRFTCTR